MKTPVTVIVGRPNVGKSSLFNAIAGKRISIVHEESGVTRDRIVAPVTWRGRKFQLIDTGGLGHFSGEKKGLNFWEQGISEQVKLALEDADILLFVVDVQCGVLPLDREVANILRSSGKPLHLVLNKSDNPNIANAALDEFASLGIKSCFPVSTVHRIGINELLEAALSGVTADEGNLPGVMPFPIAVIGRPNVGKSSTVNRFLGENRVMVSDVPGTTRDAVDVNFELEYKAQKIPAVLIDTAGLRKRTKVDGAVEKFSVIRAEEAIKRAKLVLFVVEAKHDGLTSQDRYIARMITDEGKACIILANKWDLCQGHKQPKVLEEIRYTLPHMNYAPVIFTCARTGMGMETVLDAIAEVMAQMEVTISTSMLNRVVQDAIEKNSPSSLGPRAFKIYYGTMTGHLPPCFTLFVNNPELCPANYLSYLNNYFRKSFDFTGLPIRIRLRARPKAESIFTDDKNPHKRQSRYKKTFKPNNKKTNRKRKGDE